MEVHFKHLFWFIFTVKKYLVPWNVASERTARFDAVVSSSCDTTQMWTHLNACFYTRVSSQMHQVLRRIKKMEKIVALRIE